MWGIYANDADKRYLRIKSTPEKLLNGLIKAHPTASQDTCFIGKVQYLGETVIKEFGADYLTFISGGTRCPLFNSECLFLFHGLSPCSRDKHAPVQLISLIRCLVLAIIFAGMVCNRTY